MKCFKKVENQTSISTNTKPAECLRQCCQKEKVRSVRSICPSTKKGTKQAVPGKHYDNTNGSENRKRERLVLLSLPSGAGSTSSERKGIAVSVTLRRNERGRRFACDGSSMIRTVSPT